MVTLDGNRKYNEIVLYFTARERHCMFVFFENVYKEIK